MHGVFAVERDYRLTGPAEEDPYIPSVELFWGLTSSDFSLEMRSATEAPPSVQAHVL